MKIDPSSPVADDLGRVLRETFFVEESAHLNTEDGAKDLASHVHIRYNEFVVCFIPWIQKHTDLAGKVAVEVGCGTGSAGKYSQWPNSSSS